MRKLHLVSVLLLLLLLAACGPAAPAAAPQAPAPAAPAPAPAPASSAPVPAKAAWQAEWDKTVEAAKKEHSLVQVTQIGPVIRQEVTNAFTSTFGIGIEWLTGTSSQIGVKLVNERRAGIFSTDVGIIGHVTPYLTLKPAGFLESLDKVLFLPDLTDPQEIKKAWRFGELEWVDKDHTILVMTPNTSPALAINTQLVKPGEIKGYRDLLNPKWKGKILLMDPTVSSGFAPSWAQAVGGFIMGWDYMRQLVQQEPFLTRDNRLAAEWLAHGKYAVTIAVEPNSIKEFIDLRAPVQILVAEEGSYTASGGNVIINFKNAPHPNAARLYVNWLLTREGQTVLSKASINPSGRSDVPTEGLSKDTIPDPKLKYAKSYSEEMLLARDDSAAKTKEIFGKLSK